MKLDPFLFLFFMRHLYTTSDVGLIHVRKLKLIPDDIQTRNIIEPIALTSAHLLGHLLEFENMLKNLKLKYCNFDINTIL